jgi:hypothetical protein
MGHLPEHELELAKEAGLYFGEGVFGALGRLGPLGIFPLDRLATNAVLLLIGTSIFIGVIHCSVGSILGIKTELNYGEKKHAYFERLPVMLFQVFFSIALLGLVMGQSILTYLGIIVVVISVVMLLGSAPTSGAETVTIGPFAVNGSAEWTWEGAFIPGEPYALYYSCEADRAADHQAVEALSRSFVVPENAGLGFRLVLDEAATKALDLSVWALTAEGERELFDTTHLAERCPADLSGESYLCPVGVELDSWTGKAIQLAFRAQRTASSEALTAMIDDIVVIPRVAELDSPVAD